MEFIEGGVTAAKGFTAGGIHCGIRRSRTKKDLALIVSQTPCAAAAVYTTNKVFGAPITVTRSHLANGTARAVICNSGNANTCNADGVEIAEAMCALVEKQTGIPADEVIVASTGVIGQPLDLAPIAAGMPALAASLSADGSAAAEAIMTTDTKKKEIAVAFTLGGKRCVLGGIAKGSGMICPNMATMLVFITTDAAIDAALLQRCVSADVADSFNMITVDGDTSTNDMLSVMANGLAGNATITDADSADYQTFAAALHAVTSALSRRIAGDGEGATKLLECVVNGAADAKSARLAAKAVVGSSLVKAAMFGADANWGRVLCALGYSGAETDVSKITVDFCSGAGSLRVCENGAGVDFDEAQAKKILSENEITIAVGMHDGAAQATAWGCDLTYDYVKINGDYRT